MYPNKALWQKTHMLKMYKGHTQSEEMDMNDKPPIFHCYKRLFFPISRASCMTSHLWNYQTAPNMHMQTSEFSIQITRLMQHGYQNTKKNFLRTCQQSHLTHKKSYEHQTTLYNQFLDPSLPSSLPAFLLLFLLLSLHFPINIV